MTRQHPSQQGNEPFYVSDATLPFTTNLENPHNLYGIEEGALPGIGKRPFSANAVALATSQW